MRFLRPLRSSTRHIWQHCTSATSVTVAATPSLPKVIVITGPTAVGKSAIGLELARRLNGEVISADSVQVYTGLDVGSDKVTQQVRDEVHHHLIDILPPTVDFSAGLFHDLARKAADDILQRGKVPIVVGGTGFYLRWLVDGRPSTPASDPKLEKQVLERIEKAQADAEAEAGRELSKEEKWEVAVGLLVATGDTQAAERISKETFNYYRLQRALQILTLSPGKTLAELDAKPSAREYNFRCFFLNRNRIALWQRIMDRCEEMVVGGLLTEALWLEQQMAESGVDQCQAGRAIGYSQALDFLKKVREEGSVDAAAVKQLVHDIASGTRQLVRKQLHWFRAEPAYQWVDLEEEGGGLEAAVEGIMRELEMEEHRGGSGGERTLSRDEEKALKRVQHRLKIMEQEEVVQPIVDWVRENVLKGGS